MTRLLTVATLAGVALWACGGARSTPRSTPGPTPPTTRPPVTAGSGSAVVAADVPAASPTDAECDTLVAHALAIEMAERPADQQLAAPERETLLARLRDEQRPGCRALTRDTYRCLLAAAKVVDLASCK